MSVFDRITKVVKSEWNHRFGEDMDDGSVDRVLDVDRVDASDGATQGPLPTRARSTSVPDVDGAMRVLELTGVPTLDVVRARYRELACRYHPRTTSEQPDHVHAAHVVLLSLTDALELLEEHLLPMPHMRPAR